MADTLFSATQTGGIAAGLNTNFRHRLRGVIRRDNTTNSTLDAQQQIMRGFGVFTGDGSAWGAGKTLQVTYPNSGFDNGNISVFVNYIGFKDGTAPTDRTDVTRDPNIIISANTSQTLLAAEFLHKTDANTVNNRRYCFEWLAIGDKASVQ